MVEFFASRNRFHILFLGFSLLWTLATQPSSFADPQNTTLQGIHSFDVVQFHHPFDTITQYVRPELYQYTLTALQTGNVLPYQSPAEATLYLTCNRGPDCRTIEATVRVGGENGPVVWKEHFRNYHIFLLDQFWSVEKSPQRLGQRIIDRLAKDYQSASRTPQASVN